MCADTGVDDAKLRDQGALEGKLKARVCGLGTKTQKAKGIPDNADIFTQAGFRV